MTIRAAITALTENLEQHLDPRRDPARYNETQALLHIAQALRDLQATGEDLKRRLDRIEAELRR